MPTIVLRPWERRVSGGVNSAKLTLENGKIKYQLENIMNTVSFSGCYGIYDDEFFAVFLDPKNLSPTIGVGEVVLPLESIESIDWQHSLTCRHLSVNSSVGVVDFKYQRIFWNLLRRPWYGIFNVLLAEDWWGVTCDLPAWTADNWKFAEFQNLIYKSNKLNSTL